MRSGVLNAKRPDADGPAARQPIADLTRYGLAALSLALALGASLLLQRFQFRDPAAILLLFAVAISSWFGGPKPAALSAILSIGAFYWYFVEPVRTPYINLSEIPNFIVFAAFAWLMSWFGTARRSAEAVLREQASLLNLTHDTVFVMDMDGVIQYWNRGAEERYGWTVEQAAGKVVHDLLQTVFPVPLEEITAELVRTGRWMGELAHTRKDGTQLVVASRWALQRDARGAPFAILETNNDITERKRAEEALRRSNRELRAISNCNQTLLRATDERDLLQEICRIVCEEAGYSLAWVGYVEHDEAQSVRPVAWAGTEEAYLATARISWSEDTVRGRGPTGTAIRSGKTNYVQDFAADARVAPWREGLLQRGFRSAIALPLKDEHANVFGSLTIHSVQPNALTPEEIHLLEELAGDLAFGLVTLRSRAARQRAEQEVALLSFALNNVREAALLVDEGARFHYVNEEACRILGFSREELLGMSVPDIDPGFPKERWQDHWRDLNAQRCLNFESVHRTKEGRVFPVEISANYLEYGDTAYDLALVRDISERKEAQRKIEQSEERLRLTLEATQIGVFDWDVARDVWYASPVYYTALGYEPSPGPGDRAEWVERLHPEDRDRVVQLMQSILTGEREHYEYEARMRDADGSYRWIQVKAIGAEHSADGKVSRTLGVRMDITGRKRAEEKIRRQEMELRQILDFTPQLIAVFGPDRERLYANQPTLDYFGVTDEEWKSIPGRLWFYHPDDRERVAKDVYTESVSGVPHEFEARMLRKDGAYRCFLFRDSPLRDEQGRIMRWYISATDIEDRKRAEEAQRRLADQLRLSFDAIIVWQLNGTIESWNRGAEQLYGYNESEALGRVTHELLQTAHPVPWPEIEAELRESGNWEGELRQTTKGGQEITVSGRHQLIAGADGVDRVLEINRDITERKRAEERLRQSEAELRQIVDVIPQQVFVFSADWSPVFANRREMEYTGLTSQQTQSKDAVARIFHPEDLRELEAVRERARSDGAPFEMEARIRRKDGEYRWFLIRDNPLCDEQGRVLRWYDTRTDIEERKRAEKALREQANLLNLTHDTIFVMDIEGVVKYWNRRAEEQYGWPAEQVLGRVVHDLLKTVFPSPMSQIKAELLRTGHWEAELVHTRRNGTKVAVASRWALQRDEDGAPFAILETNNDITARKRTEDALLLSNAYNRSLIEASLDPLVTIGPDGKITDVNAATEAATGHSRGELIGTDFCDYFTSPTKARAGYGQVFREGLVRDYPLELRHRDGHVISVLYNASVYRDESGQVVGVFAAARDITERKLAEEALRRSEAYLADAQRLTHTGAWASSPTGAPLYWSEEMFRLNGFDPQRGLPALDQALQRIHPEDLEKCLQSFRKVIQEKVDSDVEFRIVLPDGTVKHAYGLEHPVLNANGELVEVLGTAVDITERKHAEDERERLRQLEADLAHIDRISILGELTASIAHEVNQPLAGVVSNASAGLRWLAADVPNLEEAREGLRRIVRDGKRAGEVIHRIRALTKKTSAARERLDLNQTVGGVLALVGDEAKNNRVIIRTRFADDLPPVLGDQVQLQQVVLNLIMNAIEAMRGIGEGARELLIATRHMEPDQVQVTVEDSGVGIDPEMIHKIFDSFYTTKPGGMGMGLSISRSILQAHGGRLWATPNDGPGAAFHFTLPSYHEEEAHAGGATVS